MKSAIWVHNPPGECPPGLLYNMSVPSKTVVSYSGLAGLSTGAGAGGRSADGGKLGIFGSHLRFVLAETVPTHDPALLVRTLGIDPAADATRELERLIEARARELPLPDACLVVRADPTHPCRFPDVLSALAVLTKCSEHVWLRGKSPNLSRLAARREASLLLPPAFSARIQEFLVP
jgi:hypothetical protein